MYLRLSTCFLISLIYAASALNNVCESVEDYYTIQDNPNCWYDYITDFELPEIVKISGRPFEIHKVVTSDGYILSLFRISKSLSINKKASPVFLQHGLVSTSKNWVSLGNDSLAFQLHDNGFDVWIGNFRGTEHSTEHVNLTENDEAYWDYTVDEMSLIDLPAMFDKVVETTGVNGNIIYIGHSIGAAMGLMYASDLPSRAKTHMKAMILLGAPYTMAHSKTPLRQLAKFSEPLWKLLREERLWNVVSRVPNPILRFVCLNPPSSMLECIKLLGYAYGPKHSLIPSQYPNFLKQQFSKSSLQIFQYLAKSIFEGEFTKFDYGLNNTSIYGQEAVPKYNVTKIDIPTILFVAKNDWLIIPEDIVELAKNMNKNYVYKIINIDEDNFNHMSYVFGSRTKKVFIDVVMREIENLNLI